MKRHFYSAESDHGSESSFGFCNDTTVLVWDSRAARDEYVNNSRNLSCRAIRRAEVTSEASNYSRTDNRLIKPRPFTFDVWGIDDAFCEEAPGLIGEIVVSDGQANIPRFYK